MVQRVESRVYIYREYGKPVRNVRVTYTIVMNAEGKVEAVYNQFGNSVERDSECFEYFSFKHNRRDWRKKQAV